MKSVYGYVRVSSKGQNEARQLQAMEEQNILRSHIYVDKQSGKDFNRPQYMRLLKRLKPGDLLIIHSIDRLAYRIPLFKIQKIIEEGKDW